MCDDNVAQCLRIESMLDTDAAARSPAKHSASASVLGHLVWHKLVRFLYLCGGWSWC